jgi:hypothetical protein
MLENTLQRWLFDLTKDGGLDDAGSGEEGWIKWQATPNDEMAD